MKYVVSYQALFLILLLAFTSVNAQGGAALHGKKVLWVDSYHGGYEWSDGIELGIRKVFKESGVELKIHRMDTKNNNSIEYCRQAGTKAKAEMDSYQPDLVIATDDNAQKYFVVPYVKETNLPVVFSGVNWDADEYGYPTENVTGMVEVDHVDGLISLMKMDADGARVGFLSTDVVTARKTAEEINDRFFNNSMKTYMVTTFSEFKRQFLNAQDEVDMLILYNYTGIQGWDAVAAESFLAKNTRVPTGAMLDFLKQFAVYTNSKLPEEQGEYAARAALRILTGTKPGDMSVVRNKNSRLTVNLKMAKAADIVVPLPVLKTAEVVGRDAYEEKVFQHEAQPGSFRGKKVAWVDSYDEEYEWSAGLERGIKEVFVDQGIEVEIIHMDTRNNKSAKFARQAALDAFKMIEAFAPDAVIASDDNAQKYLVVPYLTKTKLPVIFCGVNRDASMYGYPLPNVTGMLEIEPIYALLELLGQYSRGKRVGYLCGNRETERKMVESYQKNVFSGQLNVYMVETFSDFKRMFLQAQQEVDMMILPNYVGIADWPPDIAEEFIRENVRIPTGSFTRFMDRYVLFTMANSPEEQGNYAAAAVLRVFGGEKITDIPIVANKTGDTTVNVKMADAAGIVIPLSTLKGAKAVIGQETFWKQ